MQNAPIAALKLDAKKVLEPPKIINTRPDENRGAAVGRHRSHTPQNEGGGHDHRGAVASLQG